MPVQPGPAGSAEPAEASGYVTIGGPARVRPSPLAGLDLAAIAWPAFLAAGLGCLAVGVILLVWPAETLVVAAILIGASLVVAGLLRLIHGFTTHDATGAARAGSIVIGLLAIALGLFFIRHYHVTIAVMAIVVGLFWVINGFAEIAGGMVGDRGASRGLAVLLGLLSVAAGLIVLFWPAISITVLVVALGIWLIVYGILLMTSALMMRQGFAKAAKKADQAERFAPA
jgi:uncharacterized membrane protein HdeD (DUF308 family)